MLSKNEQGFANVCGTSSVHANSEAAEVADEIDRMIEKDRSFIDEVEPTATYLFFRRPGHFYFCRLTFDWLGCALHTGTKGL
jgi:hypothetical protein